MGQPEDSTEWLVVTLPWIIIITGLVGNLLSAMVLLRKRFRKLSLGVYLLTLAITDSIFLLSNTLFHWGIEILFEVKIQALSDAGCAIVKFIIVASRAVSAWVLVLFSMERSLAISIPHLARTVISYKRAVIGTIIVSVLQFLLYSYDFAVSRINQWNNCYWTEAILLKRHHIIINIFDFLNYCIVPSVVMATSNSILIHMLCLSREVRSRAETESRSIVITIITTTVAFILLTMPMTFFQILAVIGFNLGPRYVYPIVYSLDLLNHGINFLLYCVSGPVFRAEIRDMVVEWCPCLVRFFSHSIVTTSTTLNAGSMEGETTEMGLQGIEGPFSASSPKEMNIYQEDEGYTTITEVANTRNMKEGATGMGLKAAEGSHTATSPLQTTDTETEDGGYIQPL